MTEDDFEVTLSDLAVEYSVEIEEIQAGVKKVTITFDNNGVAKSFCPANSWQIRSCPSIDCSVCRSLEYLA